MLASVSAWQAWSQVPERCPLGVNWENVNLGCAYLDVALDGLSPPHDAVQYAMLAREVFEAFLAYPSVGSEHNMRGEAHLHLSTALWVLARYSLNGRESLLASAREHARRAADLGTDTTWIDAEIDALSAEMVGARPVAAAGA